MIIDDEVILEGFVKATRKYLGSFLSFLPGTDDGNGLPLKAVIQDIQDGVRPDYPYITAKLAQNSEDSNSWHRTTYVDENDTVHHVIDETITVELRCYGDLASSVLKKFRLYVLDDDIRHDINSLTGATFVDFSEITRRPAYLSTGFVNTAVMTASLAAISDWFIPDTSGIIDTVTGEASYLSSNSDGNPISVTIDTSSS